MKKLKIGKSDIHGKGLFTGEPIRKGDLIAKVHSGIQLDPETVKYMPTQYGRFYNHADKGFNTRNEVIGNHRYLRALKNIPANTELTANYREHPEMEQPENFGSGKYASFDFDKTIATDEGLAKARQMLKDGYNLFIVSARDKVTPDMVARARKAGIPEENIIATGSDEAKVRKVKQLGVEKHFDDKPEVIAALGLVGEQFKKGGGVNSKRYTKSLTGTNKLFTKNNLFKKKSTKRIYDPNAKYFDNGGETKVEPEVECTDDGRCYETDQIQNMLDTGSEIPYDNLGVMWSVQEAVNPEGVHPGDANKEWMSRGAQSLSAYLGMKNPANCMWAAGMGYQCLPETKGKLPKSAFKSNDSFISAVNKGSIPFKRVTKTNEPDFDSKEKGLLRPGDIINFKGTNDTGDKNHPSTSHAMTFSHYREDGVPIYLDSNGEATDFNWNQGVWSGMKPNKKRTAYISRFDPEMFYKDKIETLEEAARNNPTYYRSGGASEQKIIFSPKEGGCPEGQYWTGTECKIIPKNTKIVYSEEELAKLNISKKEQQKLYNQYISRVHNHAAIDTARKKVYGNIGSKDKFYKTFESIPRTGWDPWMSYGTGQLIPNGLGPGIPSLRESMISFSQWKKMMDKSSVKPIGFKGHPGGGHFYPVYEKPSNYLLGYNKEEPVIPIDPVKEEVIDPVKETEVIDPTPTPTPTPDIPLVESIGIQDYPEELKGTDWEWDRKYHSFTTPRLNKHFPLGPLFNGKKKHNFSTPYLHRRKDYEDGGIIADFSTDQIQEYINGGYIVEEIDDYAKGGGQGLIHARNGGDISIARLSQFNNGGPNMPTGPEGGNASTCEEGYLWDAEKNLCVPIVNMEDWFSNWYANRQIPFEEIPNKKYVNLMKERLPYYNPESTLLEHIQTAIPPVVYKPELTDPMGQGSVVFNQKTGFPENIEIRESLKNTPTELNATLLHEASTTIDDADRDKIFPAQNMVIDPGLVMFDDRWGDLKGMDRENAELAYDYQTDPEQDNIHSLIFEERYKRDLKPNQTITEEDINKWKAEAESSGALDRSSKNFDHTLYTLFKLAKDNKSLSNWFNQLASNDQPKTGDEPQYTKQGGSIGYQLGDEVDEATMKQLINQGYIFEKIR